MISPTRQGRVLIAEDDGELRRLLATSLRHDGYEVEEVSNGYDLLRRASRPSPPAEFLDLVISDVRMPYMSGLEVLTMLRSLARGGWATPVILITAFGDADTHAKAKQLGAVIFDKPFDLDELRARAVSLAFPIQPQAQPPKKGT